MTTDTAHERQYETRDLMLNMGPQHPSTHGVFRMVLTIDGEVVRDVVPYIGYLHRGAEKLCETMDFRQGIGFMDRTEYLAAFNAELSYVMAVEHLGEVEVPERAQWIRMILCELNRLSSHFMFTGALRRRRGRLRHRLRLLLPRARGDPGSLRGDHRRPHDVRLLPARRAGVGGDRQLRAARARGAAVRPAGHPRHGRPAHRERDLPRPHEGHRHDSPPPKRSSGG